jgi:hypothetical protein
MFEETQSEFIWFCDGCGLAAAFPNLDFYRSVAESKNRNWLITREREGGWAISVPDAGPSRPAPQTS